jgi:hypothetical protein
MLRLRLRNTRNKRDVAIADVSVAEVDLSTENQNGILAMLEMSASILGPLRMPLRNANVANRRRSLADMATLRQRMPNLFSVCGLSFLFASLLCSEKNTSSSRS